MMEDQKLINLLVKIESKIDNFITDKNMRLDIAQGVKELIKEKLNLIESFK